MREKLMKGVALLCAGLMVLPPPGLAAEARNALAPKSQVLDIGPQLRTKQTRQTLKSLHFVHVDGFDEPVLGLRPPEKERICVDIHWIWEFGQWLPDRISFPAGSPRAGKTINLKRLYDPNGRILRIAATLSSRQLQEGRIVSQRFADKGRLKVGARSICTLPEHAGKLAHIALGANGIPIQFTVDPGSKSESVEDLLLFEKNGKLFDSATTLFLGDLAKRYKKIGSFRIRNLKVAEKASSLHLGGESQKFFFPNAPGASAIARIGPEGFATILRLKIKGRPHDRIVRPRLFEKDSKVFLAKIKIPQALLAKTHRKVGEFWVKNLRVGPREVLKIGNQSFPLRGYSRARAKVLIGAGGYVKKIGLRKKGSKRWIWRNTVIMEKDGLPVHAMLTARNFDPRAHGDVMLKGVRLSRYGVAKIAGEIYCLPDFPGQNLHVHFDATGQAQEIAIVDSKGSLIKSLQANHVLRFPVREWAVWSAKQKELFAENISKVFETVRECVPDSSPLFMQLLEEGMFRGLATLLRCIPTDGQAIPQEVIRGNIRVAVAKSILKILRSPDSPTDIRISLKTLPEERRIMLFEKNGEWLGRATTLRADELSRLHEQYGDFQIHNKWVSPGGNLSLGSRERIMLFEKAKKIRNVPTTITIGNNGYAKLIRMYIPGRLKPRILRPRILKKGSRVLGIFTQLTQDRLRETYDEYGTFWVTNLRLGKTGVLFVGNHRFLITGFAGGLARVKIGPDGVPTKLYLREKGSSKLTVRSTIIVEQNGKPVRAFLSARDFDPDKYPSATLKGVRLSPYGLAMAAGEIFSLPEDFAGKRINIAYDAKGEPQTVDVVNASGNIIAHFQAEDVWHRQIDDWDLWTEEMRMLYDENLGLVNRVVQKFVSPKSPLYEDLVEEGRTRGLHKAIKRAVVFNGHVPSGFLRKHILGAVADAMRRMYQEPPADTDVIEAMAAVPADAEESIVETQHARKMVNLAVDALSPMQRELMHMMFYDDLSMEDAARELNRSLDDVEAFYDDAMAKLEASLRMYAPAQPSVQPGAAPEETVATALTEPEKLARIRPLTAPRRLDNVYDYLLEPACQEKYGFSWKDGGHTVADIGPGFEPVTALGLAKRIHPNEVVGVDVEIPAMVLQIFPWASLKNPVDTAVGKTLVLFDKQGNVMDAIFGIRSLRYSLKDDPTSYQAFAAQAKEIRESMQNKGRHKAVGFRLFDPHTHYTQPNFKLLEGSMTDLPFQDNSLRMALILNVYRHYDKSVLEGSLVHISHKLKDGGLAIEGSAEPDAGSVIITRKEKGKMIPKEVLFLDWTWLQMQFDRSHFPHHRALKIVPEQQRRMVRILRHAEIRSETGNHTRTDILQGLVKELSVEGFIAALTRNGRAFTLELKPDLSLTMGASYSRPFPRQGPEVSAIIEEAA